MLALLALSTCGDAGDGSSETLSDMEHSRGPMQSCLDADGNETPDLCMPSLICNQHICKPPCESLTDCPGWEGFEVACNSGACDILCLEGDSGFSCPETGEAPLTCFFPTKRCGGDPMKL